MEMLAKRMFPAVCVIAAAAVAISGHDGWYWFLFAGFLSYTG